jgi:hypothetical protein
MKEIPIYSSLAEARAVNKYLAAMLSLLLHIPARQILDTAREEVRGRS